MGSFPSSTKSTLSLEEVETFLSHDEDLVERVKNSMENQGGSSSISADDLFQVLDPLRAGKNVDSLTEMNCEYDEETGVLKLDADVKDASELDASDLDLVEFKVLPRNAHFYVVNANFSGNDIVDSSTFLSNFLYLRVLNLSGNPINVHCLEISFKQLQYVLDLDLSFVSFENQDKVLERIYETCFPRLQKCNLENCEITKIPKWNPETLIELNISENRIESLENLSRYKNIQILDMSENPISTSSSTKEYKDSVLSIFPTSLVLFDKSRVLRNDQENTATPTAKPLSSVKNIRNKLLCNDTIADQMEFTKDKCSCLEGNPCISKYVCKDWAHREEIAKAVRLQKGIRDLRGEIT